MIVRWEAWCCTVLKPRLRGVQPWSARLHHFHHLPALPSLVITPWSSTSTPLKAFSYSSTFPSSRSPSWARRPNSCDFRALVNTPKWPMSRWYIRYFYNILPYFLHDILDNFTYFLPGDFLRRPEDISRSVPMDPVGISEPFAFGFPQGLQRASPVHQKYGWSQSPEKKIDLAFYIQKTTVSNKIRYITSCFFWTYITQTSETHIEKSIEHNII